MLCYLGCMDLVAALLYEVIHVNDTSASKYKQFISGSLKQTVS